MDKRGFTTKWASSMQAIVATLTVLAIAVAYMSTEFEAWGDERYVLKGELKQSVEAIGGQIKKAIEAGNKRTEAEKLRQIEAKIVDLEDDIIWFSENDAMPSAKRRCRKLIRAVREWNDLSKPVRWESDRIVQGVCDQ